MNQVISEQVNVQPERIRISRLLTAVLGAIADNDLERLKTIGTALTGGKPGHNDVLDWIVEESGQLLRQLGISDRRLDFDWYTRGDSRRILLAWVQLDPGVDTALGFHSDVPSSFKDVEVFEEIRRIVVSEVIPRLQ